jgi:hypothetical protein
MRSIYQEPPTDCIDIRPGISAEIRDMDVRAQPRIVSEVPAVVIRVLVNHDRIGIPEPVVAIIIVSRRNTEVEIADPEAVSIPAGETEHVARPETTRESSVFKRMIDMIAGIIPPGIVSDPLVIGMNVGCFRVPRLIRKSPAFGCRRPLNLRGSRSASRFLGSRWLLDSGRCGTMGGDVAAAYRMASADALSFLVALLLSQDGYRQKQ